MFLVTNENMGLCLYMVGIQSTVEKWAKRIPDTAVETTLLHRIVTVPCSTLVQLLLQWNSIFILLSHKHLTIRSEWANFKDKTQNIIISLIFSLTGLQKCHNITQQHNVGLGSYFGFDIRSNHEQYILASWVSVANHNE